MGREDLYLRTSMGTAPSGKGGNSPHGIWFMGCLHPAVQFQHPLAGHNLFPVLAQAVFPERTQV